jgi:P-type conjugative transfer protein TrbJ
MMLRSIRRAALIGAAGIALAFAAAPARGQTVVYDPSNYAQNVLQAARALQQINNQITSLQNQTQRLLNQVRNLTSLPYSSLQAIEQSISRTQQLLNQAQRIAYGINQIDQAFQRTYPQSYAGSTSSQQLIGDAQTRWQNSLAAHQDALRIQAGVVQSLDTSRIQTNGLVSSSQSAVGILQASQAGNQLIALQTRQLVDLTALIAAQARAQSLDGARNTANQEQGQHRSGRHDEWSVPRSHYSYVHGVGRLRNLQAAADQLR